MSTYVPFNQFVFMQAYAGAVAGLNGQSTSLQTTRGYYTDSVTIAGAWAQALDTAWGSAQNPDQFEFAEIEQFSNDLFQVFNPNADSDDPTSYAQSAAGLLAVMTDAETYLASIGVTPGEITVAVNNSADVSDATIAAPGAAPATFCFMAMLMTAQETGIFDISWAYPWNSGTNGDLVTLAIVAEGWSGPNWVPIKSTGKIVLSGETAIGNVGSGVGAAVNGGTAPGISTATAAGTAIGATITGASPSTSTVATVTQEAATALLGGMNWQSGQAVVRLGSGNAAAAAGFAIGSPVLIRFEVSATDTITMTGGASFKVTERTAT